MKNLARVWVWCTLVGITMATASCSSQTQSKKLDDNDSLEAVPVEIATADTGIISAYYSSTATLEADQEAEVVAKVRGIVSQLNVEEGDYVQAGELLAQLEDQQLKIEAERAKATLDRLQNELSRKKELYRKKLISAQEFENAMYEYQAQKSAYELAKLQVRYLQIEAPISGIVSERMIKVGNMINADQAVFRVTDFDPLLAVLDVPEHEMYKLQPGQPVQIKVDAIAGQSFGGEILRISPVVNPETGTFQVTVSIRDESKKLKPGMFGRVDIIYDTHSQALIIPKNALIDEDGTNSVFVIRDKVAYRQTVRTGYADEKGIEILVGLAPADTVVTVGQSSLQDSALVEIIPAQ